MSVKRINVTLSVIMVAMLGSGMVGIALAKDPSGSTTGIGRTKEEACAMATANAERAAIKAIGGKQERRLSACFCDPPQGGNGVLCRVKWGFDAAVKTESRGANR